MLKIDTDKIYKNHLFIGKQMDSRQFELDGTKYNEKICALIQDEECHLFIDTNIIYEIYKIDKNARNELIDWFLQIQTRLKIPNWVVHEYNRHTYDHKVFDSKVQDPRAAIAESGLNNFGKYIGQYVSSAKIRGTAYTEKADLVKDFEKHAAVIKEILKNFKILDQNEKSNTNKVIYNLISKCKMDSDLVGIMLKAAQDGPIRLDSDMPPGYKDKGKEENKYGDLVVWYEILDYCKTTDVKKAIFITQENKNDLTYSINGTKTKLVKPSMLHEFFRATGDNQFYIINLLQLAQCLYSHSNDAFNHLSICTQYEKFLREEEPASSTDRIQTEETSSMEESPITEEPASSVDGTKIEETRPMEGSSVVEESAPAVDGVQTVEAVEPIEEAPTAEQPATLDAELFTLSESALADKDYATDNVEFTVIINGLKSYNWPTQTVAVNQISTLTSTNKDFLFVLGRNIYQAACGNSFTSQSFIDHLIDETMDYNLTIDARNILVGGIFYEAFFDKNGDYRTEFKTRYMTEIYNFREMRQYSRAITFIKNQLEPHIFLINPMYYAMHVIFDFTIVPGDGLIQHTINSFTIHDNLDNVLSNDQFMSRCSSSCQVALRLSTFYKILEKKFALLPEQIIINQEDQLKGNSFSFAPELSITTHAVV